MNNFEEAFFSKVGRWVLIYSYLTIFGVRKFFAKSGNASGKSVGINLPTAYLSKLDVARILIDKCMQN